MRSSPASAPRRKLVAAATTSAAVALTLTIGLSTACSGLDVARGRPRQQAPAPVRVLGGASQRGRLEYDVSRRYLLGASAAAAEVGEELDYGYVDPPPDTHRRGGSAPIPHN